MKDTGITLFMFKALLLFTLVGYATSAVLASDRVVPLQDYGAIVVNKENAHEYALWELVYYYTQPIQARQGVKAWVHINFSTMDSMAGACLTQVLRIEERDTDLSYQFYMCISDEVDYYVEETYRALGMSVNPPKE